MTRQKSPGPCGPGDRRDSESIVLCADFEICLGMRADGANLRGFQTGMDMTAVAALPLQLAVLQEHIAVLDVLSQLAIALLMLLLHSGNAFHHHSDGFKALFPGFLCHGGIHVGPLIVLAGSGIQQIGHRVRYSAIVQELDFRSL